MFSLHAMPYIYRQFWDKKIWMISCKLLKVRDGRLKAGLGWRVVLVRGRPQLFEGEGGEGIWRERESLEKEREGEVECLWVRFRLGGMRVGRRSGSYYSNDLLARLIC